jgi:hypothetical protein
MTKNKLAAATPKTNRFAPLSPRDLDQVSGGENVALHIKLPSPANEKFR